MISISEAVRQITQSDVIGIQIWRVGEKFGGQLINRSGNIIPNTSLWEFQLTVEDVIQELVQIAAQINP
jgi:hypothetical protein